MESSMAQTEERQMNANTENATREPSAHVIDLGAASTETKGVDGPGEPFGLETGNGISED